MWRVTFIVLHAGFLCNAYQSPTFLDIGNVPRNKALQLPNNNTIEVPAIVSMNTAEKPSPKDTQSTAFQSDSCCQLVSLVGTSQSNAIQVDSESDDYVHTNPSSSGIVKLNRIHSLDRQCGCTNNLYSRVHTNVGGVKLPRCRAQCKQTVIRRNTASIEPSVHRYFGTNRSTSFS